MGTMREMYNEAMIRDSYEAQLARKDDMIKSLSKMLDEVFALADDGMKSSSTVVMYTCLAGIWRISKKGGGK